jgi:hypothetical protein
MFLTLFVFYIYMFLFSKRLKTDNNATQEQPEFKFPPTISQPSSPSEVTAKQTYIMPGYLRDICRGVFLVLLFFLNLFWFTIFERRSSFIIGLAIFVLYLFSNILKTKRVYAILGVAFLLTTISPVDISCTNYPGPPRIVPYIPGRPSPESLEAEKRGEVYLTRNCYSTEFRPDWIIVW